MVMQTAKKTVLKKLESESEGCAGLKLGDQPAEVKGSDVIIKVRAEKPKSDIENLKNAAAKCKAVILEPAAFQKDLGKLGLVISTKMKKEIRVDLRVEVQEIKDPQTTSQCPTQ
jgi:hypothetical protein